MTTTLEIGGTSTSAGPYNNPVGSVFDASSVSSTPVISNVQVNINATSPNWKCALYKCDSSGAPTDLIEQITITVSSTGWNSLPFTTVTLDNEFAFVCLKPDTSSGRPFAVSGSGTPPSKEKAHTNYAQNFVDGEFTQTFGYTINIKADFTAGAEPSGDTLLPPPVAWI